MHVRQLYKGTKCVERFPNNLNFAPFLQNTDCIIILLPTFLAESDSGYNYDLATVLVVTFVVNNHVRDEDNKKAMAWEQAMLDYLHDYKKHHTKYIDIEYSTEVEGDGCVY